jgi:VanZ family protein
MKRDHRRLVLPALFVLYWIGLFFLTHVPRLPTYPGPIYKDKIAHLLSYALLIGLALTAHGRHDGSAARRTTGWVVVLSAYACIDELLQPLSGRTCQLGDWIANVVGLLMGVACYFTLSTIRRRYLRRG